MSRTITILGRQPALGLAELESLFGAECLQRLGNECALLDIAPADFPMERLGGTMKAAKLLTYIDSTDWQKIEDYLVRELPKHTCCLPPGKVRLGLSVHGLTVNTRRLGASGLTLKKVVKNPPDGEGRSVRVVPNNALELNTAQVIHNQLTGPTGMELVLIRDGNRTALAQTFAVQDIDAYAARDQKRPKRDARVGMLPPKLAQIIVNLATGTDYQKNPIPSLQHFKEHPALKMYRPVVLDPFCGTGVILQEALLMGYDLYGTDREPRMIEYTKANLDWLVGGGAWELETADATDTRWRGFDVIASETYLGRPFTHEPDRETLQTVMQDVDTIHRKFLQNLAKYPERGFNICIAVPAWKTKHGFKHLKTLDSLEELGYTRMSFAHVSKEDLLYYRDNQVVARELVVLTRK